MQPSTPQLTDLDRTRIALRRLYLRAAELGAAAEAAQQEEARQKEEAKTVESSQTSITKEKRDDGTPFLLKL